MNLADRSQPPAALLLDVAWCEPALSELPVVGARGKAQWFATRFVPATTISTARWHSAHVPALFHGRDKAEAVLDRFISAHHLGKTREMKNVTTEPARQES